MTLIATALLAACTPARSGLAETRQVPREHRLSLALRETRGELEAAERWLQYVNRLPPHIDLGRLLPTVLEARTARVELEARAQPDWSSIRVRYVEATTPDDVPHDGGLVAELEARGMGLQLDRPPSGHPAPDSLTFGPGVSIAAQRVLGLLALESGLILRTIGPGAWDAGMAVFEHLGDGSGPPWSVDTLLAAEQLPGPVPEELRDEARATWLVSGLHSAQPGVRRRDEATLLQAPELWTLALDRALARLDVDAIGTVSSQGRLTLVQFLQQLDDSVWTSERVVAARAMIASHQAQENRSAGTIVELMASRQPGPGAGLRMALKVLDDRLATLP